MSRTGMFGGIVTGVLLASILAASPGAAAPKNSFGPGDPRWDAYYNRPGDTTTWGPFCAGGGATESHVTSLIIPSCTPAGTTTIYLPAGHNTPGFQCVELADRWLYVAYGLIPVNGNGAQVAGNYAATYHLPLIPNGTAGAAPQVGDVISFSAYSNFGGTGHVAVVSATNVAANGNGTVTILSENASVTINLSVAGWVVHGINTDDGYAGYIHWLHVASAPAATGSANLLRAGSFEATASGWGVLNPGANLAIYDDVTRSHDGHWFGETNTGTLPPDGTASVVQDITGVDVAAGRSYDFSVWLRSPSAQPYGVCVALWALGGTAENGVTCRGDIGSAWTLVTAPLDIHGSGHSSLRAQIYLYTPTISVDLDGAEVVSAHLSSASFEGGTAGWSVAPNMPLVAYQDATRTHDGQWFGEMNTGTLPPDGSGSIYQDITGLDVSAGRSYDFSVWLRSPNGQPFGVCVALWALGGTNEPGSTCTTIGFSWTEVTAPLDIHGGGHTALRAQIYLYTAGINIDVDGTQVTPAGLSSASFEASNAGWVVQPNTSFASYQDPNRSHDGQWFGEANRGTVPPGGDASLYQEVSGLDLAPGESYDFTLWVRSPTGQPYGACVAVWAIGGTTEGDSTCRGDIGSGWTAITASLDIIGGGHSVLRAQLYLGTDGINLDFDGATLAAGNARVDPTTPSAPQNAAATAGDAQATVTWTPPASDGGAVVTGYTVTATPGGATASAPAGATSAVVPGLANGTPYTFTVTATNGRGTGPASAPSNTVTPQAAMSVTGVNPGSVARGATNVKLTITGTGFARAARVQISGTKVTVVSVSFVSATTVRAVVSVGANAPIGGRTVTVVNRDTTQASCASCLTVT